LANSTEEHSVFFESLQAVSAPKAQLDWLLAPAPSHTAQQQLPGTLPAKGASDLAEAS
jgi:hypothetical protein